MSKRNTHVGIRITDQPQKGLLFVERKSLLPPPNELERYEALQPGITDRLLSSYEKQQEHRMELEKEVISTGAKQSLRGQIFAFILGAITIIGGLFLLIKDKNVQGYTLIVGSAATLAGVFVYGKRQNEKERIEKARLNPEQNRQ